MCLKIRTAYFNLVRGWRWSCKICSLLLVLFAGFVQNIYAQDNITNEFTTKEKAVNFGIVYATQWTFYLSNQKHRIEDHGSFENWSRHPFEVHMDKDSFDYNLYRHTFVGHYYFLFYRSRGYSESSSFVWSFLSSSAFEFTIETITERPSVQDLHMTPVLGTIAGMGVERISHYLFSLDRWYTRFLAYLLNPFVLFPPTADVFQLTSIQRDGVFTVIAWKF